jgi:hypothetical protein
VGTGFKLWHGWRAEGDIFAANRTHATHSIKEDLIKNAEKKFKYLETLAFAGHDYNHRCGECQKDPFVSKEDKEKVR